MCSLVLIKSRSTMPGLSSGLLLMRVSFVIVKSWLSTNQYTSACPHYVSTLVPVHTIQALYEVYRQTIWWKTFSHHQSFCFRIQKWLFQSLCFFFHYQFISWKGSKRTDLQKSVASNMQEHVNVSVSQKRGVQPPQTWTVPTIMLQWPQLYHHCLLPLTGA